MDEFDSGGTGPHQIQLMPDGHTLAVANGGILTHPQSGRKKLNLATMASNLTYVDVNTGNIILQLHVPESKASIRHIAVADDGLVAIAMQVQRQACDHNRTVALGALHHPNTEYLQLLEQPDTLIAQMQDYAGSVALHPSRNIAGLTSPRGNLAAFWSTENGQLMGYHSLHDVCGIAVSQDQQHFVLSNSTGQMRFLHADTLQEDRAQRIVLPDTQWDNHLLITQI